jgi:hypothetical protein
MDPAPAISRTEIARSVMRRHESMRAQRATWDTLWQDIANYVMPRKAQITSLTSQPSTEKQDVLFDTTAIRANMVLANGQLAWMTPHESRWFSFEPPPELDDNDEAKNWFKRCTEIAQAALSRSNFYTEIHELYLDRGAFGTACMFLEEGKRQPLLFDTWNVGLYSIAEDEEGTVDTVCREFELTTIQAEDKFGEENLSPKLRKLYASSDVNNHLQKHWFIHCVYPREERDPQKVDGENMPFASVYLEKETRHVCRVGGYRELPFFATRYLKWGSSAYGWSPSWVALPEARQLNFLERQMDALAELAAFPRVLVPSGMDGEIDLRAAGVTYFNPANPSAIPREWGTSGRYDVGQIRGDVRRKAIEEAFHVDLFQMFSRLDKQMTAREVGERSGEKLTQFSPTFTRMTTELFNPLLERVFSILIRGGHFPEPPQSLLVQDPASGEVFLPPPRMTFNSRIALAIRALETNSFARHMDFLGSVAQMRPEVLDNYDMDRIARDLARNEGLNADWMLDQKSVEETRARRAAAAAQQAQMEQAAEMAKAAAAVGKVPADSPVMGAMGGALGI